MWGSKNLPRGLSGVPVLNCNSYVLGSCTVAGSCSTEAPCDVNGTLACIVHS